MPGRSAAKANVDEAGARERLVATAYELFSRRGIRDVGVNEVIARAGVAKATLYKHFRTKDELVLAFLERRETRWTREWVEQQARRRAKTPEEQLLAIFDLFDEWFHRDDFEACSFINVLLEMGPQHPQVRRASGNSRHPLRRRRPRSKRPGYGTRLLRTVVAHSREGLDHLGCRGRTTDANAEPSRCAPCHRPAPSDLSAYVDLTRLSSVIRHAHRFGRTTGAGRSPLPLEVEGSRSSHLPRYVLTLGSRSASPRLGRARHREEKPVD
jgi:AcrR family transcriptional regulator